MRTSTVSVITDPVGTASPRETTIYLELPCSLLRIGTPAQLRCRPIGLQSTVRAAEPSSVFPSPSCLRVAPRTHFRLDASAASDCQCLRATQFDVRAQTFDRDQRLTITPSNISKVPETELDSDQSDSSYLFTRLCRLRLQRISNCHGRLPYLFFRHRYEHISS
jgi:hypothetical protein